MKSFTIKELCTFLDAEIPQELKGKEEQSIKSINARYTTLEAGDVFFDINNDCEDLRLINPKLCPFIISDRDIEEGDLNIPIVKINNALDRYVELCKKMVDTYPKVVRIAVTGSTGKTSMKETIASILSNVAATNKTFSNQNNIYFLSKRLQNVLDDDLHFYVQEACVKVYENINLTQKLAEAFQPKVVVMTNIYDNHAEVYGDRETTFKIKSSLVEEMGKEGIALLNMDDEILREYHPRCKTYYYSLENPNADIYASNIKVSNEGTSFDIHWQGRVIKNVFCHLIGKPNIYNCLVSFAIGSLNGADDELLARAIAKMKIAYSLRQNHMKIGPYNLFIDCFNASPESIEHDMDTMEDLTPDENGRKVVVIGDIAELGEKAEYLHEKVGNNIARHNIDRFFCFGEFSDYVYRGAIKENPLTPISAFHDREELEKNIKQYIKPGDLILWKASRNTHIELSIDNIFGTDYYPLYPNEYDVEALVHTYPDYNINNGNTQRYYRMGEPVGGLLNYPQNKGLFEYCIYENGIKFVRNNSIAKNVKIPKLVGDVPIRSIGDRAFYCGQIVTIEVPDSVVNIATNAFLRCYNLTSVRLSENLKFLDYSAFAYCTALKEISIPQNCLLIRKKAFFNCKRLHKVVIKGMDTLIEKDAFEGCEEIQIICKENSLAHTYAIENGIPYVLIDDEYNMGNVVVPPKKEKNIVINYLEWEEREERSRLNIGITVDNTKEDILWYELDNKWKKFVCDDRIDAVVVSLILFAIRGKYTKIKSHIPISEKLKYQLTNHLIPQIVDFEGEDKATAVVIDAPTTNYVYDKDFIANGTGFSGGVDSFATLYEYGHNSDAPEDYKVNFLNFYNIGAFHGMNEGKRSYSLSRDLYNEQAKDMMYFAKKYGYNALVVDSNLALFIRAHFNSQEYGLLRKFQNSATERNIGTTLLFQKLFNRFYYSSGHTLKEFKLSLDEPSALWEQYAVQFFSTENIDFYISNRNWTRMEKVERVAELPEAYDNLQVCLVQSKNCGVCMKCKRTLMNLDVLGDDVLNRFSKSFDLDNYRKKNRKDFFDSIWKEKDSDGYAKDILQAAINRNSYLIKNPPLDSENEAYTYRYKKNRISVMSAPTYMSKEIYLLTNDISDDDFKVNGVHRHNWAKVSFNDNRVGYINLKDITLLKFRKAESMTLNAGKILKLNAGKQYGMMPVFTPKNGNEQVNYAIEDNNVAYVSKMGRIFAISEGTTVLTATSETGLVAKCIIEVVPTMKLNAGESVTINVGKKYGFIPIFNSTKEKNEVEWSVSDDNVAIVNRSGVVYAIAEGQCVLKARSKSGASASCVIHVKIPTSRRKNKFYIKILRHLLPSKFIKLIKNNF